MSDTDPRTFVVTRIQNGITFRCSCGRTWVTTATTTLPLIDMTLHGHSDDEREAPA